MSSILIVEDHQVLLAQITQAMRDEFPEFTILPARGVDEAQVLISEYEVPYFIIDIFLQDGNGIDFLCDVKTIEPDSLAILMTGNDTKDYQDQIQSLGILKVLEKPFNPVSAAKLLRRSIDSENQKDTCDSQFQASLSNLTSVDIIQLKCFSRATQVLQFQSAEGATGKLYFQRGEILHAVVEDTTGMDAFTTIVRWKGGRVTEIAEPISNKRTLHSDWQSLLLDTVHRIDEDAVASLDHKTVSS
ncbi:MAG: DUF4388 domain-containing protein [Verrucomicrobiota bacterium]